MGRTLTPSRILAAVAASLLLAAACTTHKQETPPLTGPSALGTSLVVTVTPSVIAQDGTSQSLVQIQAYDSNGGPLRNASLRVEITVDGAVTDFGRLSAKNVVTDANGRASVTYTAPAAVQGVTTDAIVQIAVTPAESDFANATARFVSIRLTPPNVIGPQPSPIRPEFNPPSATVGNPAVFQATVTDATGADATNQVTGYQWNFGDGGTASGKTATHTYNTPGSYAVTLTITDTLGRTNFVTHSITVGQGALPTATFLTSPASPAIHQTINFNASGSTAEPGHNIVDYAWNFGDGTLGSGPLVTHVYTVEGVYTVTLKVTDDAGRKSALASQTITVSNDQPRGTFTYSPSSPSAAAGTFASVTFDATQITAIPGRTIVSYAWDFGDGTVGSGSTISHQFLAGTTHLVILRVTDSAGSTKTISQSVTVTSTEP
jgi:PKD repeat protein